MGANKNSDFLASFPDINAEPLWTVMEAMVPPRPSPKCIPHIWEYQKIRPALIEAGKSIKAEEAERRVLMLVNPTMGKLLHTVCIVWNDIKLLTYKIS
jgi:gentisate 1,2-dioxygenase